MSKKARRHGGTKAHRDCGLTIDDCRLSNRSMANLNPQSSILNPRPAFTLVELLVVVVLVGLLATTVTVRLQGATDDARLRAAAVQIEQTLRAARHRARTFRETTWLLFQSGSPRYRLIYGAHRDVQEGGWQSLDGVTIARVAALSSTPSTDDSNSSIANKDAFALRITPTGATLPWALEIHAGTSRCVLWTDGVSGRLRRRDDVELDALPWQSEESGW